MYRSHPPSKNLFVTPRLICDLPCLVSWCTRLSTDTLSVFDERHAVGRAIVMPSVNGSEEAASLHVVVICINGIWSIDNQLFSIYDFTQNIVKQQNRCNSTRQVTNVIDIIEARENGTMAVRSLRTISCLIHDGNSNGILFDYKLDGHPPGLR